MLFDILSGTCSDILSDILSGILSGIFSDILSGSLSGIYSDILSGICSGIHAAILSGMYSGILSGILWRSGPGTLHGLLSLLYGGTLHSLLSTRHIPPARHSTASWARDMVFGSRHIPQPPELSIWLRVQQEQQARRRRRRRRTWRRRRRRGRRREGGVAPLLKSKECSEQLIFSYFESGRLLIFLPGPTNSLSSKGWPTDTRRLFLCLINFTYIIHNSLEKSIFQTPKPPTQNNIQTCPDLPWAAFSSPSYFFSDLGFLFFALPLLSCFFFKLFVLSAIYSLSYVLCHFSEFPLL